MSSRYGKVLNVPQAIDLSIKQLKEFISRAIDPVTYLPFHGYREKKEGGLGIAGWTRGVGWFSIGLTDTLAHLPKDNDNYAVLSQQLNLLVSAVSQHQTENGCWKWAMTFPQAKIDTSGSAMIGYSIERGIEIDILDPDLSQISEHALKGIMKETNPRGVIGHALADCNGLGLYANYFKPAKWAQGPATALCAMILKKTKE